MGCGADARIGLMVERSAVTGIGPGDLQLRTLVLTRRVHGWRRARQAVGPWPRKEASRRAVMEGRDTRAGIYAGSPTAGPGRDDRQPTRSTEAEGARWGLPVEDEPASSMELQRRNHGTASFERLRTLRRRAPSTASRTLQTALQDDTPISSPARRVPVA
jgi:hypothetical protein